MIIEWSLNSRPMRSEVSPFKRLVDYLRQDLKLLGTNIDETQTRAAGVSTVWMDGKVVNASLLIMGQVDGHEITTIEGINQKEQFTPLQESFLKCAAVECGFCIPGMLMTGTALLEKNPNPTRLEIREALKGHLCACMGYQKIVDAIQGVALPPVSSGEAKLSKGRV